MHCPCGNHLSHDEISLCELEERDVIICHACFLIEVGDIETMEMNGLLPVI